MGGAGGGKGGGNNKKRGGKQHKTFRVRQALEASFVDEAEIVFTTLTSSSRRVFRQLTHGFDTVLIDEAAQANEVATLIPFLHGARRCVLVGGEGISITSMHSHPAEFCLKNAAAAAAAAFTRLLLCLFQAPLATNT